MRIERVNIEDVYPVEDEYGNQYLSRDYTLKENMNYVEELARSFGDKGEPNEPPVLVEDGGIYRIKAGNSRVRAMELLGTRQFTAIIDEDDTPRALVEAAIRTDTKKAYEPIERSRFEQQLFLFDDDEFASKVTGRSVEDVRMVRRTMEAVEDAAEDMTIERMIALAEFEDDPETYQEIRDAKESEWQRIADSKRKEREVDPEEEARKERKDKLDALYEATEASREAWLAEHVEDDMPKLCELADDDPYSFDVSQFIGSHGIELPYGPADAINGYLSKADSVTDWQGNVKLANCADFVRLTDAMAEYGYEPCEEEQELYKLAKEAIDEEGKKDE